MFNIKEDTFTELKLVKSNKFLIIFLGVIVYSNALFNYFVWDDIQYVIPNSVANGLNLVKHFSANIFNSYGFYRPVPAFYSSIIYSLFGQTPFFYHFPQIGLHIVNAVLFYIFLKIFFEKKISFILALIFLVHPMQVESVSYIAQTSSVLFFFFGISALLLSRQNGMIKKYLFMVFFLLLLSMLTKEAGIIFLVLIPLMRGLFKKRQTIIYSLLSLTVLFVYAFIRFYLAHIYLFKMSFVPISRLSFSERLINIPEIFFYYLKTFLFPLSLASNQNWVVANMTFKNFYFSLIMLIIFFFLIILLGIRLYRDKKEFLIYIFFLTWFILGMSLYLQIFPLDMTVADRWFYFPIAGLLGLLGIWLQKIYLRFKNSGKAVTIILFVIIILFSVRTISRNMDWQTPMKLYAHDAKITDSYNLESHLASELLISGRFDDALEHYKKSVALLPYETTLAQIGYVYERKGDIKQAEEYYRIAMNAESAIPPYKHAEITYIHVARFFLYQKSDPILANLYIKQGLTEYPNSTTLWVLLALDEYKMQHQAEALMAIKEAYVLTPSSVINYVYTQMKEYQPLDVPIETFYE